LFVSDTSSTASAGVKIGIVDTVAHTITNLPGIPIGNTNVPKFPIGFYMADLDPTANFQGTGLDTLYIGDDGAGFNNGGITKWAWNGTNWVIVGTINADPVTTPGFYYLQGVKNGTTITLYSTYGQGGSGNTGQGALYGVTDTAGYNANFSTPAVTTLASVDA